MVTVEFLCKQALQLQSNANCFILPSGHPAKRFLLCRSREYLQDIFPSKENVLVALCNSF